MVSSLRCHWMFNSISPSISVWDVLYKSPTTDWHDYNNWTPYMSLLFEFRSHLLLAADVGGHHCVCALARGCHQRGRAVQADGRQHQCRGSGFPSLTGRPAVRICRPWGQRLDHQKRQKVCIRESAKFLFLNCSLVSVLFWAAQVCFLTFFCKIISKTKISHSAYSLWIISHLQKCVE